MSDEEVAAELDRPAAPEDVSSAARSCSVILVIMAFFGLILCGWIAVIIFR
jgi:hypothetical protein